MRTMTCRPWFFLLLAVVLIASRQAAAQELTGEAGVELAPGQPGPDQFVEDTIATAPLLVGLPTFDVSPPLPEREAQLVPPGQPTRDPIPGEQVKVINAEFAQVPLERIPQVASNNPWVAYEATLDYLRTKYCVPPRFATPRIVPQVVFGPGASLVISTGSFSINEDQIFVDKLPSLRANLPSVRFVATPPEYRARSRTEYVVTTRFCRVLRTFGVTESEVLFVFDGKDQGDSREKTIDRVQYQVQTLRTAASNQSDFMITFMAGNIEKPFNAMRTNIPRVLPTPANRTAVPTQPLVAVGATPIVDALLPARGPFGTGLGTLGAAGQLAFPIMDGSTFQEMTAFET